MKLFVPIFTIIFFWSCDPLSPPSHQQTINTIEKFNHDSISMRDTNSTDIPDTTHKHKETPQPIWSGPLLMIINNEAAILRTNSYNQDSIDLKASVKWAKDYLRSDSLYSLGLNGLQLQQFDSAYLGKPFGDCNQQIVLTLSKDEKWGFLAGSSFLQSDSIQYFWDRNNRRNKLVVTKPVMDSIFGIYTDTIKTSRGITTENQSLILRTRSTSTRMYNEGLEEEHFFNWNSQYQIAVKKDSTWLASEWTPCSPHMNGPRPELAIFEDNQIRIIWGASEGMGDYSISVSKIEINGDSLSFELGPQMTAYIGMGCD